MTDTRRDQSVIAAVLAAVLSAAMAAYAGYSHNDKELAVKIATVETKQANSDQAVIRIETKVDKTNDKLDKLVEWALGKR